MEILIDTATGAVRTVSYLEEPRFGYESAEYFTRHPEIDMVDGKAIGKGAVPKGAEIKIKTSHGDFTAVSDDGYHLMDLAAMVVSQVNLSDEPITFSVNHTADGDVIIEPIEGELHSVELKNHKFKPVPQDIVDIIKQHIGVE